MKPCSFKTTTKEETTPAAPAASEEKAGVPAAPIGGALATYLDRGSHVEPTIKRFPAYMVSFHERSSARHDIEAAVPDVKQGDLVIRDGGYRRIERGSELVVLDAFRYWARFTPAGELSCALPEPPTQAQLDALGEERLDECVEALLLVIEPGTITAASYRAKNATLGLVDPVIASQNASREPNWARLSPAHATAAQIQQVPLRVIGRNISCGSRTSKRGLSYNTANATAVPASLDQVKRILDWAASESAFFEGDVAPEFEARKTAITDCIGETTKRIG